jgi:hypothetical protein
VEQLYSNFEAPWSELWVMEAKAFARELLIAEAIDYLYLSMGQHGFSFSAGDRTRQVFGRALESFDLGAVYNLVWRSTRDAAAYYLRDKIPKKQAANSVVGGIERGLDRAVAEGWEVKSYRRTPQLPWSVLSETFLVTLLNVPDPMSVKTTSLLQLIDQKARNG